jgi:hypothetical protein
MLARRNVHRFAELARCAIKTRSFTVNRMILALGLMAAAAIPTLGMAQPYERDQGRYCDDQGRCFDRAPDARDYSRDSGYRDQDAGRDYSRREGDQFTGRVGSHWIDAYGRRCAWREVSFHDNDGYQAFKWVTVCRE